MHAYFKTADDRVIAIRNTGMPAETVAKATSKLTRIPAPTNAKARRISGEIPTCRVLEDGQIGSI